MKLNNLASEDFKKRKPAEPIMQIYANEGRESRQFRMEISAFHLWAPLASADGLDLELHFRSIR